MEMSLKWICQENGNDTKTEIHKKIKGHYN